MPTRPRASGHLVERALRWAPVAPGQSTQCGLVAATTSGSGRTYQADSRWTAPPTVIGQRDW